MPERVVLIYAGSAKDRSRGQHRWDLTDVRSEEIGSFRIRPAPGGRGYEVKFRRGSAAVNGIRVKTGRNIALHDGWRLKSPQGRFLFLNLDERIDESDMKSLGYWRNQSRPADREWTDRDILAAADLCGTAGLHLRQHRLEQVLDWCNSFGKSQDRPHLPITLPMLIDLGSLILLKQPQMWHLDRGLRDPRSVRSRYCEGYQQDYLCRITQRRAVKYIRERVSSCKSWKTQREIVVRFLCTLLGRLEEIWMDTGGGDDEGDTVPESVHWMDDPLDIMRYQRRIGRIALRQRLFDRIDPLTEFLLGARTRVATAFEHFDALLISRCLRSRELGPRLYRPDPIFLTPRHPHVPRPTPGAHTSVRAIRTTSQLEELPEVIPQDLAYLRSSPDGRKHLLQKLMHEGLLKWERQSYAEEYHRKRFLVGLVADIGTWMTADSRTYRGRRERRQQVAPEAGSQRALNSPDIHARQLVFEILRDIGRFAVDPTIHIDVHVYLEPVGRSNVPQMHWATDRDELRRLMGSGVHADMLTLEERMSGYFFRAAGEGSPGNLEQFVSEVWETTEYDLVLLSYFASEKTISQLLPYDLPPRRQYTGIKDVIQIVRMGAAADAVEVCRAEGFEEVAMQPAYEYQSDRDLRYGILEVLLGRSAGPPDRAQFECHLPGDNS